MTVKSMYRIAWSIAPALKAGFFGIRVFKSHYMHFIYYNDYHHKKLNFYDYF